MSIRDEDLIQYLLGEADAVLVRRIQLALQAGPQVAGRLDELRFALGLLDSLKSSAEPQPPNDLVANTLSFIDDQSESDCTQSKVRLRPSDVSELARRSSRRVWESLFAVASVTAVACLMLPLVIDARSVSRQLQCGYNLKSLGAGLTQLAMFSPERRYPEVPLYGPDSFAGRFALQLNDHGLLESPTLLRCFRVPVQGSTTTEIICVPTTQAFLQAGPLQQSRWREELGGDYAYNFGVIEDGRVAGTHLEGNSHLAILADAPQVEGERDVFTSHEGRGFNTYYEDGHVAFSKLSRCRVSKPLEPKNQSIVVINDWRDALDYPFRNAAGRQAHGLNLHDASLGPSSSVPQP